MSDREEAQGEGQGLDEILRQAASGVLKKAEGEKAELRGRIAALEDEVKFLRGGVAERRYELRFAPRDTVSAGGEELHAVRVDGKGGIRSIVAIRSAGGPEEITALRDSLPPEVLVVGLPPGAELSVLELIPAEEGE